MSRVPFSSSDGADDIASLTSDKITVSDTKVRIKVGNTGFEVLDSGIQCKGNVLVATPGITFSDGTTQTSRGENPLTFANSVAPVVGGGIERPEGSNQVIYHPPDMTAFAPLASPSFTGNVTVQGELTCGDAGKIFSQVLLVNTTYVNIPLTAKRGAFIILASSTGNDDAACVAMAADAANYPGGTINMLVNRSDYNIAGNVLQLQWGTDENLQIRMAAGNDRYVSILVLRA